MPIVIAIFIVIGAFLVGNDMMNPHAEPVPTDGALVETTSPSLTPTLIPTNPPVPTNTPTPIPTATPTPIPPPSERAVRAATFLLSTAPENIKNKLKNWAEQAKTDELTNTARIIDNNSQLLILVESIEQQVKDKRDAAQSQALQNLYSNMNTYRPPINSPVTDLYKNFPMNTSVHCSTYYGIGYSSTDCY